MPVVVRAELNEANLLECKTTANNLITRVDAAGTIVTKVNTERASASLANGECAWWYDGDVTMKFKARDKNGTIRNGSLTLN